MRAHAALRRSATRRWKKSLRKQPVREAFQHLDASLLACQTLQCETSASFIQASAQMFDEASRQANQALPCRSLRKPPSGTCFARPTRGPFRLPYCTPSCELGGWHPDRVSQLAKCFGKRLDRGGK